MGVFSIPGKGQSTQVSLGPQLQAWMEHHLVHGPGDVRGEPYRLDKEKALVLYCAYEIWPKGKLSPEGKQMEGRRRFKRVALSVRKGWAKTEFAAAITAAELHPLAPVRFAGWAEGGETSDWVYTDPETGEVRPWVYKAGEPIGRGVKDPYVPMVAFTAEQSEELAFNALKVMLEEGQFGEGVFDIGNERIIVLDPGGKAAGRAVALASSPNARDGARTTFQVFDETHRMVLENLVKSHQTMLANIPKRYAADAWTLEITTAYEPGLGSVAEGTMEYARLVAEGKIEDSRLFFYHRQADDKWKLRDEKGEPIVENMRQAVIEASGLAASWIDIDGIVELGLDPQNPPEYWERVWLNRPVQQSGQAFPMDRVDKLVVPKKQVLVPGADLLHPQYREELWHPDPGEKIVLGFDGSQTRDTTAIVGTHIATGTQFLYAIWANPGTSSQWHVPVEEVDEAVAFAFKRWDVWRMYCDPYYWQVHVADWEAKYLHNRGPERGKPRVFSWETNKGRQMALSLKAYIAAMREGVWKYDGNPIFRSHLANARKYPIHILDEDEIPLFLVRKERPDSPLKIDAAMAGCLSWEAYRDALASGVNPTLAKRNRVPVTIY